MTQPHFRNSDPATRMLILDAVPACRFFTATVMSGNHVLISAPMLAPMLKIKVFVALVM